MRITIYIPKLVMGIGKMILWGIWFLICVWGALFVGVFSITFALKFLGYLVG